VLEPVVVDEDGVRVSAVGMSAASARAVWDGGEGVSRCKEVGAFQRWGAVNHRLRSLFACGEGDFLLPEPARSATLGSKPPGIR
jgi:hypothetical protein